MSEKKRGKGKEVKRVREVSDENNNQEPREDYIEQTNFQR